MTARCMTHIWSQIRKNWIVTITWEVNGKNNFFNRKNELKGTTGKKLKFYDSNSDQSPIEFLFFDKVHLFINWWLFVCLLLFGFVFVFFFVKLPVTSFLKYLILCKETVFKSRLGSTPINKFLMKEGNWSLRREMKYKTRTKNWYFARYFSFEENPSKGIKLNMVEVTYKKSTAVFSSRNFPLKDKPFAKASRK